MADVAWNDASNLQSRALVVHDDVTMPNAAAGTVAKVAINTVDKDPQSSWDSGNKRFTPAKAGYYLVTAFWVGTVVVAVGGCLDVGIKVNAANPAGYNPAIARVQSANAGVGMQGGGAWLVFLNGSTDFVEFYGNSTTAGHTGRATLTAALLGN